MSPFYTTSHVDAIGIHPGRRKALNATFHNATWGSYCQDGQAALDGWMERQERRQEKERFGLLHKQANLLTKVTNVYLAQ